MAVIRLMYNCETDIDLIEQFSLYLDLCQIIYNISYYLTVWSGYNPVLSLECYNHNKHIQL